MGIHLVTWDSEGLEISSDTYSSLSEIRPAAGPSARLCGLLCVNLGSPERQGLSGGVCLGGSQHGSTGPGKRGSVGRADSGTRSLQSLLSVGSRTFLSVRPAPTPSATSQLPPNGPVCPPPGLSWGRGSVRHPRGSPQLSRSWCPWLNDGPSTLASAAEGTRGAMHTLRCLTTLSPTPREVGTVIMPILRTQKPSHREGRRLAQPRGWERTRSR